METTLTLYNREGRADLPSCGTAVTVGVFDGVHLGHRHLLKQLTTAADGLATVAVTLTSHPAYVLGYRADNLWLDEVNEHRQMLIEAGADYVAEMPFNKEIATLSACQMAMLLQQKLDMQLLLIGYDSRFGSRTHDDFAHLPALATERGFNLAEGHPCLIDGEPVSSSRIRSALKAGDMKGVSHLLGRHYTLRGMVSHGRGVGHTLGFPTANIDLTSSRQMLPPMGVYAVRLTSIENGIVEANGMANLGAAPTFGVEEVLLEVHLMDYHGDLYGRTVAVELIEKVRPTLPFPSAEALQKQLQHDLKICREIFNLRSL